MSTNTEQRLQQQIDELMLRLTAEREARKKAEAEALNWRNSYGNANTASLHWRKCAEAAEARIKASQEQEQRAYECLQQGDGKGHLTYYKPSEAEGSEYELIVEPLYSAPIIPPDVADLQRENAELNRKLAEQQSQNNFDAARLRRLCTFCGVAAPDSDEELLQVAGVVIGSCLRNLAKLIEEAKRQAVPDIKVMVDRFLGWKLPKDFCPDAGISFTPRYNVGTPYERDHEPVGINLFSAEQAKAMIEYMLSAAPQPERKD